MRSGRVSFSASAVKRYVRSAGLPILKNARTQSLGTGVKNDCTVKSYPQDASRRRADTRDTGL